MTQPSKPPTKSTSTPAPKAVSQERPEDAGNVATDGPVVGSTAVAGADLDKHDAAVKEVGSDNREDHVVDEGVFIDPATVGAGTILPGGGYGPPLPDPQVQRKNEDPDYQVK